MLRVRVCSPVPINPDIVVQLGNDGFTALYSALNMLYINAMLINCKLGCKLAGMANSWHLP